MSTARVVLTADFLAEVGELLERHGHAPGGGSTPGAVGWAMVELATFVRAYRDAPPGRAGRLEPLALGARGAGAAS